MNRKKRRRRERRRAANDAVIKQLVEGLDATATLGVQERGELLWHFTTVESLRAIVRTQSLRAKEYTKTLDRSELAYADPIIMSAAKELAAEMRSPLLERFVGIYDRGKFTRIHMVFVSSFSTEVDDFSMWDRFAKNGTGVALGFRLSDLSAMPRLGPATGWAWTPLMYDPREQREHVRVRMQEIASQASTAITMNPRRRHKRIRNSALGLLFILAASSAVRFKHWSCRAEKEWRFVYLMNFEGGGNMLAITPDEHGTPCVHFPIAWEEGQRGPIAEIQLGPKAKETEEDVRQILRARGYDDDSIARVSRSTVPMA
jgi:hypothetical protein